MSSATALLPHDGLGQALRHLLPARKDAGTAARTATAGQELARDLESIRAYARFLADQADMPEEHRRRFLGRIIGSCDDALARLG